MARKKQRKKTSVSRKETEEAQRGDIPESVARATDNYLKLRDIWMDFGQKLQSSIEKNFNRQRRMLEDFSDRWTEVYRKMSSKVSKRAEDDKMREFSDIWRNYSNKMMQRLTSAMATTVKNYEDFQKNWKEQSSDLGEQILALPAEKPADWQLTFPYDRWSEFASGIQQQIASNVEHSNGEMSELTKIWRDLSTEIQQVVSSFELEKEIYKDLADLWTESSNILEGSLSQLVSPDNNGFETLRETWLDSLSGMEREMTSMSEKFGTDYESLWKWYFNTQESWRRMFSHSVREENGELKQRLEELSERVRKLEQ